MENKKEIDLTKYNMLDKGTLACALISSKDQPDLMIPVKCLIEDFVFVETTLYYTIKIIQFYDKSHHFLMDAVRNKRFMIANNIQQKKQYVKFDLSPKINNIDEFNNYFTKNITTRICIESCYVRKTRPEIVKLFNDIQEYLIFKNLRLTKELMTRGFYSGEIKLNNEIEFKIRMERGFNTLFDSNESARKFFELIFDSNENYRKFKEDRGYSLIRDKKKNDIDLKTEIPDEIQN